MSEDSGGNSPPETTPSEVNNTSSGRRRKKTKKQPLVTKKAFDTKKFEVVWYDAQRDFMSFQQNQLSNSAYSVKFKELVDRLEHLGLTQNQEESKVSAILMDDAVDSSAPTALEISNARTKSKEQYYAIVFILKSDRQRYS